MLQHETIAFFWLQHATIGNIVRIGFSMDLSLFTDVVFFHENTFLTKKIGKIQFLHLFYKIRHISIYMKKYIATLTLD